MIRAKILRDTANGSGIIFINGEQKSFTLEKHWKSGVPPLTGATVDVTLADDGTIHEIYQIDETALAKEQVKKALDKMGTVIGDFTNGNGRTILNQFFSGGGVLVTLCTLALMITWFFFKFITINMGFLGSQGISFYQLVTQVSSVAGLSALFDGRSSFNIYSIIAWLVMLAPFCTVWLKAKIFQFGWLLPLIFLVLCLLIAWYKMRAFSSQSYNEVRELMGDDAGAYANMATEMLSQSISFSFGFYISWPITIFMAYIGAKKLTTTK